MRAALASLLFLGCLATRSLAQGPGESFANPILIPDVPYSDFRSTCGYANDVTAACPTEGPDVVYAITPTRDLCVSVSMCGAGYPGAVSFFRAGQASALGCVLQPCEGAPWGAPQLAMAAGDTYYIVVDGTSQFGGPACGSYSLSLRLCPGNCSSCPAGGIPEGEPDCFDSYHDSYNSGCDFELQFLGFTAINVPCGSPPVTICGRYGDFVGGAGPTVDHDWYRVTVSEPTTLRATLSGDLESYLSLYSSTPLQGPCEVVDVLCPLTVALPCTPATCSAVVPAGSYLVRVAPARNTNAHCGRNYTLTLSCESVATHSLGRSWGQVKTLYR